jgi:hypothetical protein
MGEKEKITTVLSNVSEKKINSTEKFQYIFGMGRVNIYCQHTLFDHSYFCDLMYQISTGRLTRTNGIF